MGAYSFADRWLSPDDSWMNFAACLDISAEQAAGYFADDGRSMKAKVAVVEARKRCLECVVQVDCLSFAMETGMQGVWGGTTTKEREQMRKKKSPFRVNGSKRHLLPSYGPAWPSTPD